MVICKAAGKVVSTVKNEHLVGTSLIMVRPVRFDAKGKEIVSDEVFVAVDPIGCATGNNVLVAQGSNARFAAGGADSPVDMVIVGIID